MIQITNKLNNLVDAIVRALDADRICFMNPVTLEMEDIPNDVLIGMYYDEACQKALQRVDSWGKVITIDSPETIQTMKVFVDNCLPFGNLKEQLYNILTLRHPHKPFQEMVHHSGYYDKWLTYRRRQMTRHVKRKLENSLA